jgi:hypothetical protein
MRTFRTTKGPFKEGLFLTDSEIEDTCGDELRRVGLFPTSPEAIRIERFIEKRFGFSPCYEDLPEGVLGLTRFGAHGPQEIVISSLLNADSSQSSQRLLRTTMAHEAGHGLFHSHLFVLGQAKPLLGDWTDKNKPKVLCRDQERSGYQGEWWELHANKAMGALLMPRSLVIRALEPFMATVGTLGGRTVPADQRERAIRVLSDIFDVNPAAARVKLDILMPRSQTAQLSL